MEVHLALILNIEVFEHLLQEMHFINVCGVLLHYFVAHLVLEPGEKKGLGR